MTLDPNEFEGAGREGVVFRDKRRIDPETGEVREPRETAAPASAAPQVVEPTGPATADLEAALAERTADLQRLQAEYLNYKRRVDRDRQVVRESAVATVVTGLLPVLDDIARARDHAELTGGFKAVADSLEGALRGLGLEAFGAGGEPFDPRIHEALMHSYSDEVSEPVCQMVLQVGYRLKERVLRPARVAVAEPQAAVAADANDVPATEAPAAEATAADDQSSAEIRGQ